MRLALLIALFPSLVLASGWEDTKAIAARIHADSPRTFYEGCAYRVTNPDTGAGVILDGCAYEGPEAHRGRASRIEWEHVAPASLMPAHDALCWREGRRGLCEDTDPAAQAMIFDLHNIVPSIGQVNALRSNLRYGETEDTFEPPDCKKGDVARIWLYMHMAHGLALLPGEAAMFIRWMQADPVSPWESARERRIGKLTRVRNPFVAGVAPDATGSCVWE